MASMIVLMYYKGSKKVIKCFTYSDLGWRENL